MRFHAAEIQLIIRNVYLAYFARPLIKIFGYSYIDLLGNFHDYRKPQRLFIHFHYHLIYHHSD